MKIAIVGGGISGLSLAYYLNKLHPTASLDLYEADNRLGGVVESTNEEGFFFERGPRTFLTKKSLELLTLMRDLGLSNEIIYANKSAKVRYIWSNGKKEKVPSNVIEAMTSPLTKGVFKMLFSEWKRPVARHDESIQDFFQRRIGQSLTANLIRPMVYGIYGADISELSICHTFSSLKEIESNYGSLSLGILKQKRKKQTEVKGGLFTIQSGLSFFIEKLSKASKAHLFLHEKVVSIDGEENQVKLMTSQRKENYDYLFSTMGSSEKKTSITVCNIGYRRGVFLPEAFGVLVREPKDLLGIVFDSKIFPEQNLTADEARLTMMMKDGVETVDERLKEILEIKQRPDYMRVKKYQEAIFKPQVGFQNDKTRKGRVFYFSSNIHSKVSLPDIVKEAKKYVQNLVF